MARFLSSLLIIAAQLFPLQASARQEPDPRNILRQTNDALADLDSLRFRTERYGVGALATLTPAAEGEVIARRFDDDAGVGWKYLVKGELAGQGSFAYAYDGRSLRFQDDAARTLTVTTPDAIGREPLLPGPRYVAGPLLRWKDLVAMPVLELDLGLPVTYCGQVDVEGEPCDVVRIDLSALPSVEEYYAWWYISKRDRLPRRTDMLIYDYQGIGDGMEVVMLRDLEIDGGISADGSGDRVFTLAAPEGYTVEEKKAEVAQAPARPATGLTGKPAPDFTLMDPDGNEHTLSKMRGDIVVLDFWATWCGPCKAVMPHMQELHERYKTRGVRVFGMNCWESGDPARFMRDNDYTYSLLLNADRVAAEYQVSGIPTFIVVGPDGTVLYQGVGTNMVSGVDEAVEKALKDLGR